MTICPRLKRGYCCYGVNCRDIHQKVKHPCRFQHSKNGCMFDSEECWFTHSDQGSVPRKAELHDFISAEVKRVVTEEKVSKKKVANKTVKKLKKKLEDAVSANEALRKALSDSEPTEVVSALKRENEELKKNLGAAQSGDENKLSLPDRITLEEENKMLKRENEKLEKEVNALKGKVDSLEQRNDVLDVNAQKTDELNKKERATKNGELKDVRRKIQQREKEAKQMKMEKGKLNAEIFRLQQEVEKMKKARVAKVTDVTVPVGESESEPTSHIRKQLKKAVVDSCTSAWDGFDYSANRKVYEKLVNKPGFLTEEEDREMRSIQNEAWKRYDAAHPDSLHGHYHYPPSM